MDLWAPARPSASSPAALIPRSAAPSQRDLYCEVFAKARAKEVHQNYIFWAPPSPEGQRNYDELMTATRWVGTLAGCRAGC